MVRDPHSRASSQETCASAMKNLENLWERFGALEGLRAEGMCASATEVEDGSPHLLTKGSLGEPVFLIETTGRGKPRAPAHLKNVSVDFESEFEVQLTGASDVRHATYCRVRCLPESGALHRLFVDIVGTATSQFAQKICEKQLDDLIDGLLNVFRVARLPSSTSVLGLWGELLLIHAAEDPTPLVDGWRATPNSAFDFAINARNLEVKASSGALRVHDFSLTQTHTSERPHLVASVLVRAAADGWTVLQLARQVCRALSPARQGKVWRTVATTLGVDVDVFEEFRFDVGYSLRSLRLVRTDLLPTPHVAESDAPYISGVRFTADVTSIIATHGISIKEALAQPD
jgi:hypothetical protein